MSRVILQLWMAHKKLFYHSLENFGGKRKFLLPLLSSSPFLSTQSILRRKKKFHNNETGDAFNNEQFQQRIEEIKHIFNLRDPGQFFLEARSIKRHVIYHAGPTNSGKTYHALKRYLNAESGIYCGPLRMLAGEIYRKSNDHNVPCDMITGEERLWAVNENKPSNHVACTVEMCSLNKSYDVAVIDEIQMLRCFERGWAWTRALLGVPAKEIHVCGEEAGIEIVKKILACTGDSFEIKKYKRLTPLKVLNKPLRDLGALKSGDSLIAFSQKNIYNLRNIVEKQTKLKCAVIYGNLPSNIRFDQAGQFNSGECDVLLASDAIGMGMNLNIQRIIFSSLQKFDGTEYTYITPHHAKQIAGRAGRYGSKYQTGYVTTLKSTNVERLHGLLKTENEKIKKAGILPSFAQFELLSVALPEKSLYELIEVFEDLMELDRNYFLCDVERLKTAALEIQHIPLDLHQSYLFAIAPMSIFKSNFVLSAMKKFAWCVHNEKEVTKNFVKKVINWPPNRHPRSLRALQHLEYVHEVLDLYRWLSYRFESVFIDREGVIKLQGQVEDIIGQAVDANLNYFPDDRKKILNYVMRRRKKRKSR